MNLYDRDGKEIPERSVVEFCVWDTDDNTEWTFRVVVRREECIYLGGGVDFGSAFGKSMSKEEVKELSEGSDWPGIRVVGTVDDLVRHIKKM